MGSTRCHVTLCLGGPVCDQCVTRRKAGSWLWEKGGHHSSCSHNCHPSAH